MEENDAENIRKVIGKSLILGFWELNVCSYKSWVDCFDSLRLFFLLLLKWKSTNITYEKYVQHYTLNVGSIGKPVSFVFPPEVQHFLGKQN